ncbi:TraR/DksA C4-type zinc finger protein [Grimontia kaedaensis]|uniref:TraR/DksA C4-type zinc finger protein n=1 Tax=Grimontia kaedaensis TaxID=2872157 RepID=A0ABY4WNR6_9GAMM|nr:TraR/DksA C4-type zinc finger protein [Grimontia kaedaensis]USH01139.1 TraR/DksA C4-type zinc finger protein [Grimontia kaedaensis]
MTEHQARLENLRTYILEELDLLKDQADPVALDQSCIGRVARIDAIQQNEMAKSNFRYFQSQLLEVNAALQRLEDEEYGFCEECGVDIPDARLAIKPEVRYCVGCQEGQEAR